MDVVLATSVDPTDDILFDLASSAGCRVVRGDLADVRQRFLSAARDLDDGDIVVRATADNPVPDGDFAATLVDLFQASGHTYFATRSPDDGLPYGLSLEVFRLAALRAAAAMLDDAENREHVTPSLSQTGNPGWVGKGSMVAGDWSDRRCTIDTLEDYIAMAKVFRIEDPVGYSWQDLLPALPNPDATR